MQEFLQVATTTNSPEEAQRLATALVERRLAACVQILGPISSTYRWEGRIESATEFQCVVKTRRDLYPLVEQAIRELHSYDTPEILATGVVAGDKRYLDWLDGELLPRASDHG